MATYTASSPAPSNSLTLPTARAELVGDGAVGLRIDIVHRDQFRIAGGNKPLGNRAAAGNTAGTQNAPVDLTSHG